MEKTRVVLNLDVCVDAQAPHISCAQVIFAASRLSRSASTQSCGCRCLPPSTLAGLGTGWCSSHPQQGGFQAGLCI